MYHAPLRSSFTKLRQYLDKSEVSNSKFLQMVLYALNPAMGTEGLCLILLKFGTIPLPTRIDPSLTQLERQLEIEGSN